MKIWEQVSRVPGEHLKPFDKGTFKGTAIKPMWFIKTMTELAGPVGTGWDIGKPEFATERAGEDLLVFCTVGVSLFGSHQVYGVGGDYLYRAKSGRSDDEAYKKAYTDALTNALVKLGVGADVHMGLWNGNKYVDEKPEDVNPKAADPAPQLLTREEARKLYKSLEAEMAKQSDLRSVAAWEKHRELEIAKLGDWKPYIDKAIEKHKEFIMEFTASQQAAQ